ncbi:MAG: hypothetical protein ACTSU3_01675 [Candidatus Thorarchaeota archaeon]
MIRQTPDDIVRKEIESVRARRVILDQLEDGEKTGSQLRESIRKDMAAKEVKIRGKRALPKDLKVTDPKLYFNTKHLERIGIITSRRESQLRIFSLAPAAVHPVRRVLEVKRPKELVISFDRPEEQRPYIQWLSREEKIKPKALKVLVEKKKWAKGVSKDIDRYIPDGTKRKWKSDWLDLSMGADIAQEGEDHGELSATYREIEQIIIQDIPKYDITVDLSIGAPLIVLALVMIATDYSLTAIYSQRMDSGKSEITVVYPRT